MTQKPLLQSLPGWRRIGEAPTWPLLLLVLSQLAASLATPAATVWLGPPIAFTKPDGADWTQPQNQDRLTTNVWLTRADIRGLYNIAKEEAYVVNFSPADTEWASGTTANLLALQFADWRSWAKGTNGSPTNTVNVPAVVHLISDDVYFDLTFTSWSVSGGGFAYRRATPSEVNVLPIVSILDLTNGTTLFTPAHVTIAATASDADGAVTNVEFFDNGTSLGSVSTDPYMVTTDFFPGTHILTAVATDNRGASARSAAVTLTVSSLALTNPVAARIPKGDLTIELQTVADGMAAPLGMAVPDDGSGRMFVYDQAGMIWVLTSEGRLPEPLLDVRARLKPAAKYDDDERGLLGLATHPDFAETLLLYTFTSESNAGPADFPAAMPAGVLPDHQSVLAEWTIDATDGNRVDPRSRRELLRIDQPQANHSGGTLRFGADGFLYVALGDGGNDNDDGDGHLPGGNSQSSQTVLGKMLRINVDGGNAANGQYGLPGDNPFDGSTGLGEIYALGLRNPSSFSFDRLTGQLYLGDAGQGNVEEVDTITNGGNYGWTLKEGSFWFDPASGSVVTAPARAVPPGLSDPIAEYDHDDGLGVIGGFVYRGTQIPALQGCYVFGDLGSPSAAAGRLFFLDAGNSIQELRLGLDDRPLGHWVKGFGEGPDGELYLFCSRVAGPAGNTGRMLKLMPGPSPLRITSITARGGRNADSTWTGGQGPYALQMKAALGDPAWLNRNFSSSPAATTPLETSAGVFRVADTAHQPAIPLSVWLSGAMVRPTPLHNGSSGFGLFALEGNTFSFNVRYDGLSGPATAAHLHGTAGTDASADAQIDLSAYNGGAFGANGVISGLVVVSDAHKAMILAGQSYVDFHTTSNPGGELRGQVAPVLMQVALSGASVHPPQQTGANGLGVLALVSNQLSCHLTYRGLSGPAAAVHLHGPASLSQDAEVWLDVQPLNGGAFGSNGTLAGTATLTPAQLAGVVDGLTYLDCHTPAHPGGEMRGQLVPQATAVPFSALLNGFSERPLPVAGAGGGSAFLSLEGDRLTFSMSYSNLSGAATAARVFGPATTAQSAGLLLDLTAYNGGLSGSNGTLAGSVRLTPAQRDLMLQGQTYVNILTVKNPGGEIRGQLTPVLIRAWLGGAGERPTPVFSPGTALGTFALLLNQLSFAITYHGLTAPATGAHLHGRASVVQTAGVLADLAPFNGGAFGTAGGLFGGVTLSQSGLGYVADLLVYANIFTTNFSGGEIRGQLTR
jgi:glucose/arabinose dehydrogenase